MFIEYVSFLKKIKIYDIMIKLKKGSDDTPLWLLKTLAHSHSSLLTDCINTSINSGLFSNELKWANVIPVHKNGDITDKEIYRLISILPTMSKIFEKILFKQITKFLEDKLSALL